MKNKLAVSTLAVVASAALAVPAGAAVKIKVKDDFFKPDSKTVSKGTKVKWRFLGDNPHNVTVTSGPRDFQSGTKRSGKFVKKMRKKGTYKIVCTIHPGMDMTLKVN